MRLIRCHIENFGKLHQQDFQLTDGYHVFCKENGWGKSTLAAFFKVMFYGFANERSRDDYVNERKRFRPWQGGIYGGSITFEAGGKVYTAARTFGLKEKEDTFSLREDETDLISNAYSRHLGEELFHIDRDSFERTLFISQNDCETYTTDRIHAKLGNLAEAVDDVNQFEKADAKLNDMLNAMSPNRKTGALYRRREEIAALEEEIRLLMIQEQELNKLQQEQNDEKNRYSGLKKEQHRLLQQRKEWSSHVDSLNQYLSYCLFLEEKKKAALIFFCFGIMGGVSALLCFLNSVTGWIWILLAGAVLLMIGLIQYRKYTHLKQEMQEAIVSMGFEPEEDMKEQLLSIKEWLELSDCNEKILEIQEKLERSQEHIFLLDQKITEGLMRQEECCDKEIKLSEWEEQWKRDFVKYERLKKTKEYLTMARVSFTARYRHPLTKAFRRFYNMVREEERNNYRIDANMDLTIEECGDWRDERYLSAGRKDLLGICMRMALAEVMYKEEKPFLIFDDPFVNLDEDKINGGLSLLHKISEEYQIIYFTCHSSRT